jgi:hypothetical protein
MPLWNPFGGRMPLGARRLDAATVYLITCAIDAFRQRLTYTVLAVYYVTVVSMDPLQLVLVGTVLEGASLLFEVPTGVIAAAAGASSEGFDRLWEAHFLATFTFPALGALQPIVWFGIFNAVASVLSIVAAQALTRLDLTDDRVIARYGLLAHSGWLLAVIVFGLAPDFTVAVLALWVSIVLRGVRQPLMSTWITRSIPSGVRATVLLVLSQGDAFGQTLGSPAHPRSGRTPASPAPSPVPSWRPRPATDRRSAGRHRNETGPPQTGDGRSR